MRTESVIRAANGDSAAFAELVGTYQDLVMATAFAWLGDVELARDVAQETFLEAHGKLHQLREPEAFAGWLRRIVIKQCDRITRRPEPAPALVEAVQEQDPQAIAMNDERAEQLRRAVEELPPPQRMVIALHYFGDASGPEIANFLEISLPSVKKRLRQAKQKLRESNLQDLPGVVQTMRVSNTEQFTQEILFYLALRAGNVDEVRRLVSVDARLLAARQNWGSDLAYQGVLPFANRATPLITAIETNDLPMFEFLLDAGADVNGNCGCATGEAPIWAAALLDRLPHARLLLERGADPNAKSASGSRPLHLAAMRDHSEMSALLLARGADPTLPNEVDPSAPWFPADSRGDVFPRTAEQWTRDSQHSSKPRLMPNDRLVVGQRFYTGIKALDLFAPIDLGMVVRIPFVAGVGMFVLLGELARRFQDATGGAVVWTGFTQPPFDLVDFEADLAEFGLLAKIHSSLASFTASPAEQRAAFQQGLAIADSLQQENIPTLVIIQSASGFEHDLEACLPRLKEKHTTLVTTPFPNNREIWSSLNKPYDGQITLDKERAAAHRYPAIDPTSTWTTAAVIDEQTVLAQQARQQLADLSKAPESLLAYLCQPFFVTEPFTGRPGEWVEVDDLLANVKANLVTQNDPAH